MAARFGTLESLRDFERAIYSGADGTCELPPKRWRFLNQARRTPLYITCYMYHTCMCVGPLSAVVPSCTIPALHGTAR